MPGFVKIARSESKNGCRRGFFCGLKNKAVQLKECDADGESCTLVAVDKRVITNYSSRIQGSQLKDVGRAVGVMLTRPSEG